MKKYLVFLSFIVCVVSCGFESLQLDEDDSIKKTQQESFQISPEEAKLELCEFMNHLHYSKEKTKSTGELRITDICPIRNGVHTRALSKDSSSEYDVDIDTLMYAINFADNKGFALVAADKRTSPILAIVDEGSFSIDSLKEEKDEGFLMFVDYAINMEIQDIKGHEGQTQTRSIVNNGYTNCMEFAPLLHTKWDQIGVYGQYCPNLTAGCVIIATAQILSYFKTPGHVNWSSYGDMGSADLHWDRILLDCDNNNGKLINLTCRESANEVAHLVRYLGIALKAEYKKNQTSAETSKAIEWLNQWGGFNASTLKGYDEHQIISAIISGSPVLARGNSGKKKVLGIRVGWKGGHAWVYDGYISANKDGKLFTLIHCNWGWGGEKNGYYISKAFNTNVGAEIYDSSDYQSGETSNYKYNLEYSIVAR